MRRKLLLLLLAWTVFLPMQAQVRLQILNQQEQLETAQAMGKTVFAGDKVQVYDMQDNLILEADLCPELVMVINPETEQVSLRLCSSDQVDYDVEMAIDNTLVFNSIPAGSVIRIYSTNGTLIKQTVASQQTTSLPVDDIPAGTYVLQINNTILKVLKQ